MIDAWRLTEVTHYTDLKEYLVLLLYDSSTFQLTSQKGSARASSCFMFEFIGMLIGLELVGYKGFFEVMIAICSY